MYHKISFWSTKTSASSDFGEEWRRDVGNRLDDYGLDIDVFTAQVRAFFTEGQGHYDRLAYQDAIAKCVGLDMAKPADRESLWKQIADGLGVDRKTRGKWLTNEVDPLLEGIRLYFRKSRVKCRPPLIDNMIAPVRTAVARTLTYIRVFPPGKPKRDLPDTDRILKELEKCWDMMRRHVHFRRRGDLNQHAIDCVGYDFRDSLWLESNAIGEIKNRIESNPTEEDPLFWPWVIFKFSTVEDIISTNKSKTNPHNWIWDDSHPSYNDLWSL